VEKDVAVGVKINLGLCCADWYASVQAQSWRTIGGVRRLRLDGKSVWIWNCTHTKENWPRPIFLAAQSIFPCATNKKATITHVCSDCLVPSPIDSYSHLLHHYS
jgi:hypothetical protein